LYNCAAVFQLVLGQYLLLTTENLMFLLLLVYLYVCVCLNVVFKIVGCWFVWCCWFVW